MFWHQTAHTCQTQQKLWNNVICKTTMGTHFFRIYRSHDLHRVTWHWTESMGGRGGWDISKQLKGCYQRAENSSEMQRHLKKWGGRASRSHGKNDAKLSNRRDPTEKRHLCKRRFYDSECSSCSWNKPAEIQNIHHHPSWTDSTWEEKTHFFGHPSSLHVKPVISQLCFIDI